MLATTIAGHPTVEWGSGRPLLVVPGLNDPLCRVDDAPWFTLLVAAYCRRCANAFDRRVCMVSRPRGLRPGTTIADIASGYRDVLDRIGPADVLGISMGGTIAERLASSDERVRSLIFGLAASRPSAAGVALLERWRAWADRGEWASVYRSGVDVVTVGWLRRAGRIAATAYDLVVDHPRSPDDFGITVSACLSYEPERSVDVPTLVVGGTGDPFFGIGEFEATAERHDGRFVRLPDTGHEAILHRGAAFDGAIARFLQG